MFHNIIVTNFLLCSQVFVMYCIVPSHSFDPGIKVLPGLYESDKHAGQGAQGVPNGGGENLFYILVGR